jgi:hypothetical protein
MATTHKSFARAASRAWEINLLDVRFTPESGHVRCKEGDVLCANSGHSATLANLINSLSDHTRHQASGHRACV